LRRKLKPAIPAFVVGNAGARLGEQP